MDFIDARELEEALAALDAQGPDAKVLAGGTDVMVQYLCGEISPPTLLHIRRLGELRGIGANGRTEIGALTTHWELVSNRAIRKEHRALAEAAATVGGRQTQNVGTIGGNFVNASPAADLLPALLIADGEVTMQSSRATRVLGLAAFLLGRRQTALEPNELVTRISLERPRPRTGEVYLKVGRRRSMEVAVVGLAVRLSFGDDGSVSDARVAACSVAPTPFRSTEAEAALVGSRLDEPTISEAGLLLQESARPIDDVRATAVYRRAVLAPLLERAVATCRARAGF